jgi:phosphoglycerol transferase MdoB-like AlkP superfamily enzyme
MDVSMTSYILVLPILLFFINKWIPFDKIVIYYTKALIVLVSALHAGDSVLYREWGFRLDKTVFRYLTELHEAASFVSIGNSLIIVLLFLFFAFAGIWIFKKLYSPYEQTTNPGIYVLNFFLLPSLIIPMRGGLDIIPMNPGKVYYSSNPFSNHTALNLPWNIMYSLSQFGHANSTMHFMDDSKAEFIVDSLLSEKNADVDSILNSRQPNVLFILLESFTSKLIHKKHNEVAVTPRLNEWIERGIYFSNAYATGDRTEIGIASVFSGFPAQPQSAIVHYPRKTEKLPSMIRTMKQNGYHTTFYYGGDASFASMNSYLYNAGCDVIIDKNQFPKNTYNAKWGVHDHILFERLYDEIVGEDKKFLKICLSLSSHPPYDIPETPQWNSLDEEVLFLNTAHYTDKHLGILLDKLSKLPLWNDLLIVMLADHGARFPGNDLYHVPAKFKIPVWFGGGVIKDSFKMEKVFSQNDIAATLLYQLGFSNDDFIFGKNAFSKNYKPFAYYAFNNGFGWIDEGGLQVYSNDKNEIILKEGNPTMDLQNGKAFLQKVLNEFDRR